MAHFIAIASCLTVAIYFVCRYYLHNYASNRLPLPPGPRGLPVLGNILDLPKKGQPEFQYFLKHRELYGPISSTTVLGKTFILLHDRQVAQDLLQKESLKTSDRPITEFAFTMCRLDEFMVSRCNSDFRHRRKLLHQQLGTAKLVGRFDDAQESASLEFLLRVLNKPNSTVEHLKCSMGSLILKMTYGYAVGSNTTDPLVDLVDRMANNLVESTVPWLVDFFPALKHLPNGFPGAGFKRTARKFKKVNLAVVNIPYNFVRKQMAVGNHRPSYVSQLVEECSTGDQGYNLRDMDDFAIKRTAAALYLGGAETTVTALTGFLLAMTKFPEVQKKAQEAIDLAIGTDRLPSLADRERLPYVDAMVKEIFRWSPVAPLAFPHGLCEDIEYQGYHIPKGSVLLPMVWWFLNDPEVHLDPRSFNPNRFLAPQNEPDPKAVAFGYGRRVCPGKYFSDSNIFIVVAQLLATFNITKGVDEHGVEIEPELDALPGLISHLNKFPFKIEVRSPKHAELIRQAGLKLPQQDGDHHIIDHAAIKECLEYQG